MRGWVPRLYLVACELQGAMSVKSLNLSGCVCPIVRAHSSDAFLGPKGFYLLPAMRIANRLR